MTMTVKITFSPEAAAALTSKLGDRKVVLLALNDGSNQYSLQGGTCTIGLPTIWAWTCTLRKQKWAFWTTT